MKKICKKIFIAFCLFFCVCMGFNNVYADNVLVINKQPQNITANVGDKCAANVSVSGNGLTYQWQYSNDGGKTWKNSGIASAKTATYSFTVSKNDVGMLFRCVIRDQYGNEKVSNNGILNTLKNEDWELPIM